MHVQSVPHHRVAVQAGTGTNVNTGAGGAAKVLKTGVVLVKSTLSTLTHSEAQAVEAFIRDLGAVIEAEVEADVEEEDPTT